MPRIAIMQGRLLPPEGGSIQCFPRDRWRRSSPSPRRRGGRHRVDYDVYGADVNPLATETGVAEMRALSSQHGIAVVSLCADYFLDRPLVRSLRTRRRLTGQLMLAHRPLHVSRDHAHGPAVRGRLPDRTPDDERRTVEVLSRYCRSARQAGVELHLETSLAPDTFSSLLARFQIRCCG